MIRVYVAGPYSDNKELICIVVCVAICIIGLFRFMEKYEAGGSEPERFVETIAEVLDLEPIPEYHDPDILVFLDVELDNATRTDWLAGYTNLPAKQAQFNLVKLNVSTNLTIRTVHTAVLDEGVGVFTLRTTAKLYRVIWYKSEILIVEYEI